MAKASHIDNLVKCKPDLPIKKPYVYSVLFGFKYLLCTSWSRYNEQQVKVDLDKQVVKVEDGLALSMVFGDENPCIKYERGWGDWLRCSEWENIAQGAAGRYARAKESGAH